MLAKSLLILSLAAIGSSFTLPAGLSNGIYKASYNAAGEEVHELVTADMFNTTSPSPALPKREDSRSGRREIHERWDSITTWCGCAFPMNAGDTNAANADLATQVASYPTIWPGTAWYSVVNTAVAFVCNVDNKNANIPTDIVSLNSPDISYACGNFIAGTSRIEWPEALDYGYMNYFSGLNFCGAAQSSTQNWCPDSEGGACCACWLDCHDNCANGFTGFAEAACYASCTSGCCSCPV